MPGAGPTEIETSVCIPIEQAIFGQSGIKRLETEATEGECKILVYVHEGLPIHSTLAELRLRIQAIPRLPKGMERIDVRTMAEDFQRFTLDVLGESRPVHVRNQRPLAYASTMGSKFFPGQSVDLKWLWPTMMDGV